MTTTTFTTGTLIESPWLNDINDTVYDMLGNGTEVPPDKATLRTNIGLGTLATQNANAVNITGGTISGIAISETIAVTNGGTGVTTTTAYSPVFTGTTPTGVFQVNLGPGTSGQVLTSAGAGALPTWTTPTAGSWTGTLATAQNTTSGTLIDFLSIPSGVKRITVMLNAVSTNGTSPYILQIGDSGGLETSGYLGGVGNTGGGTVTNSTFYQISTAPTAASTFDGSFTLTLMNASTNLWSLKGSGFLTGITMCIATGSKSLSAGLDRIRFSTSTGTDTFDAGSVNILYES